MFHDVCRPAPPDFVATLVEVPLTAEDAGAGATALECAICLAKLEAGEPVLKLRCAHIYHRACVEPWLQQSSNCPVCRCDLTREGPPIPVRTPAAACVTQLHVCFVSNRFILCMLFIVHSQHHPQHTYTYTYLYMSCNLNLDVFHWDPRAYHVP
jgi:hypothetical protein